MGTFCQRSQNKDVTTKKGDGKSCVDFITKRSEAVWSIFWANVDSFSLVVGRVLKLSKSESSMREEKLAEEIIVITFPRTESAFIC
jgi:hypothetical protein